MVAQVSQPIIGADFLSHFHLLIDLKNRRLIDGVTGLTTSGRLDARFSPSVHTIPVDCPYHHILQKYPQLFNPNNKPQVETGTVQHYIETRGAPVTCKSRRLPADKYKAAKEEFKRMMEEGICRPSKSPWASPLHLVTKKDGSLRPCGDYRRLNEKTIPDRYAVPNLLDFTNNLGKTKIYSTLDIRKAYHQIPIAEEDIPKTAIITPFGLFEFVKMTFGLRNAAQTFQRYMDSIFRDLPFVFVYLDDILIASTNEQEHEEHLNTVLKLLSEHGMVLNLEKCVLGQPSVQFLGYLVSPDGIEPLPERTKNILEFPKPANIKQLRRFLGMINFYRRCLPHAAAVQKPLNQYLNKSKKNDKTPIEWTEVASQAFENTKKLLAEAVRLAHPDSSATLVLSTDASDTAMGAALQQIADNHLQPLGFFSKALSPTQRNYSTYDRELLAVFEAIRYFRSQIEGRDLIVYTDHKPLTHAMRQSRDTASPRRLRQLNYISQFTTEIRYQKGEENVVADALSRVESICLPENYQELTTAQEQDDQAKELANSDNGKFQFIELPGCSAKILCETETGTPRPYLPENFRKAAFNKIHGLNHPGVRTSRKLIGNRFFWPGMNKDITEWVNACASCQKSKVTRNTVSPHGTFPPAGRLEHVHLDIIGPLPPIRGKRYCLTMIDRTTGWPEVVPLSSITADKVASAFYSAWISRFGIPLRITTDQGRQFESDLFRQLTALLGITRIRTNAYHPQSNGLLERWHRTLKAALTAHLDANKKNWVDALPTVLLGIRSSINRSSNSSAAELLYNKSLRLPGEFFATSTTSLNDDLLLLRQQFNQIREPANQKKIFVSPRLADCTHVFIKSPFHKRPFTPPYTGPFEVVERDDKSVTIFEDNRKQKISVDRVKPAYQVNDLMSTVEIDTTLPEGTHLDEGRKKKCLKFAAQ